MLKLDSSAERSATEAVRIKQATFLGALATLVILSAGVIFVMYQSMQQFGGLPGLSGNGAILYGGVGAGVAFASGYVLWTYREWREALS